MADTKEILEAAAKLGQLIATHTSGKRLQEVLGRLEADPAAQRAIAELNRFMQSLQQKEAAGQPIEVAEKREMDRLQSAVMRNPVLRDFQIAQMEYADLMRKVDEALYGPADGGASAAAPAQAAGPSIVTASSLPPDMNRR